MEQENCDEYKDKLLQLKPDKYSTENTVTINEVFGVDINFLNLATNTFYYILWIVLVLVLYFSLVIVLSICYCEGCILLALPCYPCLLVFLKFFLFHF